MSYTYCDPPLRGPYPQYWWPQRETAATPRAPSFQEQMGIDPISKLAAAIEKLADALKSEQVPDG